MKAAHRYAPEFGKLTPATGQLIEEARTHGVNIASDMYLYTAGSAASANGAPLHDERA